MNCEFIKLVSLQSYPLFPFGVQETLLFWCLGVKRKDMQIKSSRFETNIQNTDVIQQLGMSFQYCQTAWRLSLRVSSRVSIYWGEIVHYHVGRYHNAYIIIHHTSAIYWSLSCYPQIDAEMGHLKPCPHFPHKRLYHYLSYQCCILTSQLLSHNSSNLQPKKRMLVHKAGKKPARSSITEGQNKSFLQLPVYPDNKYSQQHKQNP